MPGNRVLVVDDNATNLKLIRVLLSAEGYEVRTASDAVEAMTVLEEFTPRLILMDVQLPGMDGLALTRQIKAYSRLADVVVVAITAYAMKGDEERILAAGCDAYVSKPIDTRAVTSLVASYLRPAAADERPA